MNDSEDKKHSERVAELLYGTARGVAQVTAVFSLVVVVLLTLNFIGRTSAPMQESPAMEKLRTELRGNPGDEQLKLEIRAFDVLARRAFFGSAAFGRNGALLLCGGVVILFASLRTMGHVRRRSPDPGMFAVEDDDGAPARRSRIAIATGGVVLLLLCGYAAISIRSRLGTLPPGPALVVDQPVVGPSDEDIERNWPGFRGPWGIGVSHAKGVPVEWDVDSGKNVKWKVAVPSAGFSSPVVWSNRVFLTGASDDALEVFCFDADNGKLLWRADAAGTLGSPAKRPEVGEETGYAAPTPATDGSHVFALFATGDMLCLDYSGKRAWSVNIGVPDTHYGHGSSPIAYRGLVYVQYDHTEAGQLLALECSSGKVAWRASRSFDPSWASPVLVKHGERTHLMLHASPTVVSYDPATGKIHWQLECMLGGEVAPSPAFADGMAFFGTEYSILAAIDVDHPEKVAWETDEDLPDVSSPVAVGEHLFIGSSAGDLTCFERATGKQQWQHSINEAFYSSPVFADGRIYLMDSTGVMHVFAASAELKVLASSKLGESSVCTPAIVDGRIYIRSHKNLYCIESDAASTAGNAK